MPLSSFSPKFKYHRITKWDCFDWMCKLDLSKCLDHLWSWRMLIEDHCKLQRQQKYVRIILKFCLLYLRASIINNKESTITLTSRLVFLIQKHNVYGSANHTQYSALCYLQKGSKTYTWEHYCSFPIIGVDYLARDNTLNYHMNKSSWHNIT